MSATPQIFARIFKIDEERRLIWGRATEEVVDRADEILDYSSSKPNFEKWSAECHKDSGGKSLGNVRAMHGAIAAGKLIDITFDDAEKTIDVVSKCVDDNEWNKILEGCYTGYSIGGGYAKKWADRIGGRKVTRYTADPVEISYVDRPCVPTAKFFDIVKRDGSTQAVMFKAFATDGLSKDFTSPADSTSGIAGHDLEGQPKKKPKKDGDETEAKPMTQKMRKGCEGVAQLADLIQRLKWLADGQGWERDYEGDNSALPEKLKAAARTLLLLLAEMAIEEGNELLLPPKAAKVDVDSMAKFLGIDLEKAGRRNSSTDLSLIQTAHDCLGKLGAACIAEPAKGPITDLENPIMAELDAEKLAKAGAAAPTTGGTSGSPKGADVQSSNKADSGDDETDDERKERLAARKKKQAADAMKAAGMPSNPEELQTMLTKAATDGAQQAVTAVTDMLAKAFGITAPAAAATTADAEALAKAANAAQAQASTKRPALYAVGRDGRAEKLSSAEELVKSVDPVPGDDGKDPMAKCATMIKAIRAQGPGWVEGEDSRLAK